MAAVANAGLLIVTTSRSHCAVTATGRASELIRPATVRVYDDQPFDRQIVIPAVAFSGAKHEREHTDIYSSCRLIVRKNGAEIYNRTALDNTLIYSGVIDMPAGHGHMTLEFSVSAWLVNDWYPTASISDLLVVVMKKATAGISIS